MHWFIKTTPSPPPEDDDRDKKNEDVKKMIADFISETNQTIRDLQETSAPERKDYPIASAVRRSGR